MLTNGYRLSPSKLPLPMWDLDSNHTFPLAHPNQHPKRHFDRFSRFSAQLTISTDRHTERPRYSACNNRPHLRTHYGDAAYNNNRANGWT